MSFLRCSSSKLKMRFELFEFLIVEAFGSPRISYSSNYIFVNLFITMTIALL